MKRQSKNIKTKLNLEQPPTPNHKKQIQSPSYTNASLLESSRVTQQYMHQQNNQTTEATSRKSKKSNATQPKTSQKTLITAQSQENRLPVQLKQVSIPNDEGNFFQNIFIGVRYTIHRPLEENLRWKLIYLGSAFSDKHDQVLLNFETPDIQRSIQSTQREFKLECMPPKIDLIPPQQLFSISAIVLCASYKNQQFARVGFYIHYQNPSLQLSQQRLLDTYQGKFKQKPIQQQQNENDLNNKSEMKCKKIGKDKKNRPLKIQPRQNSKQQEIKLSIQAIAKKTLRTILVDKPRVTRFQIQWQKTIEKNILMDQQKKQESQSMQIQKQFDSILEDQHQITEYFQPTKNRDTLFGQKNQKQQNKQQSPNKMTRIVNTWTLNEQGDVICQNVERFYE